MTRDLSDLGREVADLQADIGREGFHYFVIGGDDRELSGFYEWQRERGEYVNEHGRILPTDEAPGSEFDLTITHG